MFVSAHKGALLGEAWCLRGARQHVLNDWVMSVLAGDASVLQRCRPLWCLMRCFVTKDAQILPLMPAFGGIAPDRGHGLGLVTWCPCLHAEWLAGVELGELQ